MPCKQEEEEVQGRWLQLEPALFQGHHDGFPAREYRVQLAGRGLTFLEDKQKDHYKVYNLCSERSSAERQVQFKALLTFEV
jgi:hypothetical protein